MEEAQPLSKDDDITYFAETDFRNTRQRFGIKRKDRRQHMYIIGKTGMGKTTLLSNMVLHDITRNEGICFIDPHGDAVERIRERIPVSRAADVLYFNPAANPPMAFNILQNVPPDRRPLLVSSVISIFHKLFGEHWQHRQEHILRNVLLALVGREDEATLLDVYRMLTDWPYRKTIVEGVRDPVVKSFWINEFPKYMEQTRGEALTPLLNKLGAFVTSPLMRGIIGQPWNTLDFRKVMDEGKILLVDLSKGRVGEDAASFLGAVIVTQFQLAAMSRIDVPEENRRDFYLYVDEFQDFATTAFIGILSEARKYRLSLILAHQYLGQLEEEVREAIFGNVGTIITFRLGAEDAKYLAREFFPAFSEEDFLNLPPYHVYLRLMVDGVMSRPFSARTCMT